jgi:4-carboxymuconolactone decarboxylase
MSDGPGRRRLGEETWREVMQTEPPSRRSPYWSNGRLDQEFAELWHRGVLTRTERRWISIAATTAMGVPASVRPHVYGALRSGDLTVDQLLEASYHVALYTGFPRALQLEDAVWDVAEELGLAPTEAVDTTPRVWASPEARADAGAAEFLRVVGFAAPPGVTELSFTGALDTVFAEAYTRGVLSYRQRRIITVSCVVASASSAAAEAHTLGPLRTGDLTYEELVELIHHACFVTGWPRGAQMITAASRARIVVDEESRPE